MANFDGVFNSDPPLELQKHKFTTTLGKRNISTRPFEREFNCDHEGRFEMIHQLFNNQDGGITAKTDRV